MQKVKDQKSMEQDGIQWLLYCRTKVNSKAFAIPILTTFTFII